MRTLSILPICMLLSMTAAAQDDKNDKAYEPPAVVMIDDSLGHELGLTNDQMKLVQTADENYRKSAKAGDPKALENRDRDIKAILMPTQYNQWKEIVRKRTAQAQ